MHHNHDRKWLIKGVQDEWMARSSEEEFGHTSHRTETYENRNSMWSREPADSTLQTNSSSLRL